jgi:hypothetical protein
VSDECDHAPVGLSELSSTVSIVAGDVFASRTDQIATDGRRLDTAGGSATLCF